MEEFKLAPIDDYPSRPAGVRNALEAYQAAAWRAPGATRFDSRPANDFAADFRRRDFLSRAGDLAPRVFSGEPVAMELLPRWVIVVGGGVLSALMGALLGGALAVY